MRPPHLALPLALALAGSACASSGPLPTVSDLPLPPRSTTDEAAAPSQTIERPPSGPRRVVPFPTIRRDALANGLELLVVEAKTLPLVQLRLVIDAGSAGDGDLTGLARMVALMLKDGGAGSLSSAELLRRVESLGANLGVQTRADATILSLAVPKRHLDEALDLLGTVVARPRFDEGEFRKLKAREVERVSSQAQSSGAFAASMVLYRELYRLPTRLHPYAAYDALPSEIEKLGLGECRAFYRAHYGPTRTKLIVSGDADLATVKAKAARAFAGYSGSPITKPIPQRPVPPDQLRIVLADRPGSAQSDIYVGLLGPERREGDWPELAVANQILGGGGAGRLFLDVREQRSLAYNTRSSLGAVAMGPVPLTIYAGTQTAKTGLAVQALLEHLAKIASDAPTEEELTTSRRYLADVLGLQMETAGAVADMVASLEIFGLGDDYYDRYREALAEVTAEDALSAARSYLRKDHGVLVVAGDASVVGPMLTHFGEVKVVDPVQGFTRLRTLPANPEAPLEIPREPGR